MFSNLPYRRFPNRQIVQHRAPIDLQTSDTPDSELLRRRLHIAVADRAVQLNCIASFLPASD
jgi:hypothetical protein